MTPSEPRASRSSRPRIRTIKPEALQHRKVGRLTDREFRLWVGMLTQADDEGRLIADPGQLRLLCFGYFPEVSEEDVGHALQVIDRTGLIRIYTVNEVTYACLPSWHDHQVIDRPTPSRLPAGPLHRAIGEFSTSPRSGSEGIGRDQDRIGQDRKGKEGLETIGEPTTRSQCALDISALIDQVHQLYNELGMEGAEYKRTRQAVWNQYVGADVDEEHADPIKVEALLAHLKATVSRRSPLSANGAVTR